jgi:hypothetical protein
MLSEAMNNMAQALNALARPTRAVKKNGAWEQEYVQ